MPPTLDNGPRWPARPTMYRGILMRSRLEAKFAAFLDRRDGPWEYEPMCFADDRGQYLPDFLTWNKGSGRPIYWELKGWAANAEPIRQQMEIVLASVPEAVLVLEVLSGDRGAWMHARWADYRPDDGPVWREMPIHGALT